MPKNKIFGAHKSKKAQSKEVPKSADADNIEVSASQEPGQPEPQADDTSTTAQSNTIKQSVNSEKEGKPPVLFLDVLKLKALKDNTVLVRILAVCTVLGASTELKNGLLLCAAAAAVTIPLYVMMALFFKKVPNFLYFAIAMFIAGLIVTPVAMFSNIYFHAVASSCGYFLPITAINAVLMIDTRITRGERPIIRSLSAAIGDVVGFSVVLIVISALREVIGYGTLYGRTIPDFAKFRFDFVLLPPGVFLLLGFVLAIVQGVRIHAGKNNDDGEAQ